MTFLFRATAAIENRFLHLHPANDGCASGQSPRWILDVRGPTKSARLNQSLVGAKLVPLLPAATLKT
jgi:hypothetical protein